MFLQRILPVLCGMLLAVGSSFGEVVINQHSNTYHCQAGGWWGHPKPAGFWYSSDAQKFIEVPQASDGHYTLKTRKGVFGFYSLQSIDGCIDRMNKDKNTSLDKLRGKKINTLQFMKVVTREEWNERLRNRVKWMMGGLGFITSTVLGSLCINKFCNKTLSPTSLSLLVPGILGGLVVAASSLRSMLFDPVKEVPSSESILHTLDELYDSDHKSFLSKLVSDESINIKDYVVITHTKINEHLCDYLYRRIGGQRFCLTCLCDGDHDTFNDVNDKFFWACGLKLTTTFVVYNVDHKHLLENHSKVADHPTINVVVKQ